MGKEDFDFNPTCVQRKSNNKDCFSFSFFPILVLCSAASWWCLPFPSSGSRSATAFWSIPAAFSASDRRRGRSVWPGRWTTRVISAATCWWCELAKSPAASAPPQRLVHEGAVQQWRVSHTPVYATEPRAEVYLLHLSHTFTVTAKILWNAFKCFSTDFCCVVLSHRTLRQTRFHLNVTRLTILPERQRSDLSADLLPSHYMAITTE